MRSGPPGSGELHLRAVQPGLDRILPLEAPIRSYAWGSRSVLAEMQGRPTPSAEPEAELWVGAHPLAPARVRSGAGEVPLPDWIACDPEAVLGTDVVRRFGPALPFLLKILAVEQPLSLQAHPDAAQARAGFERENRAGVPLQAPERSYKDPQPKPELVCALTPFEALKGFREPGETRARLEALGVSALAAALAPLVERTDAEGWRASFENLLRTPAERRRGLVAAVVAAARERADADEAFSWVVRLAGAHPEDLGVLAPLYLHWVRLAPGEALFLPAGELHCYLHGTALELMANSDNVLRGGLTPKHVDVDELLHIGVFQPGDPVPLRPCDGVYATPAAEFELAVRDVAPGVPVRGADPGAVALLLCTAGRLRVVPERGEPLPLTPASALLVPAAAPAYHLEGDGRLFRASVPASSGSGAA